ncbi:hypothetical protein GLE_3844 [Lysobacter enzymogenes]|uniref:Uncharacterized protein n=1 Tax=Lysobacter enzymogenes TaxID=69 RepID=A0A0S2DKZ9_LYSEN|nr:hypothetical protein GLE_3844 [Lysobacter enzymogenes]
MPSARASRSRRAGGGKRSLHGRKAGPTARRRGSPGSSAEGSATPPRRPRPHVSVRTCRLAAPRRRRDDARRSGRGPSRARPPAVPPRTAHRRSAASPVAGAIARRRFEPRIDLFCRFPRSAGPPAVRARESLATVRRTVTPHRQPVAPRDARPSTPLAFHLARIPLRWRST